MRLTSPDFFLDPPIDFEHKKWLLLSFIRDISNDFTNQLLEPSIEQLTFQIQNLKKWKYTKQFFIKKEMRAVDLERLLFVYDLPQESKEITEIDEIVDYCLEELIPIYKMGRQIFRQIEEDMKWDIVGITPFYRNEGYLLIQIDKDIQVFYYKLFMNNVELELIDKRESSLFNTYQNIKLDLIQERKSLPNPMVFSIISPNYSIEQSIIPVIKKNLSQKVLF